jgi:hypothetical protein
MKIEKLARELGLGLFWHVGPEPLCEIACRKLRVTLPNERHCTPAGVQEFALGAIVSGLQVVT